MAAIDNITDLAQDTYITINGVENDDTGDDLTQFQNDFIRSFNLWKDEFELEAYWLKLRVDDYTLATIADTTTKSFPLPDEYRAPVIHRNKYLKFVSDGIVIATFKMVDPNQVTVDDGYDTPNRATFIGRNIVLSRAPKETEVGATIVLDVIEWMPDLQRNDDSAIDLLPNKQVAVLGVAKNMSLANVVKVSLSPSFTQKYNNELQKAIAQNNLSTEIDEIQRESYGYINGIWQFMIDKPVKVKGAQIVSPSPITSFDMGLDERGDYNIQPNSFSYGRNVMVNSSGNVTKRLVKRKWLPDAEAFNSEIYPVYYEGELYYFMADDGEVKYCQENDTSWTSCGGSNSITTTAGLITTFMRVGNWVLCMNGTDALRYIDLSNFEMVQFTAVADPVNTLTAARTGLTSGGINIYYAMTYNSDGGGETEISNILTYAVNKSRATWKDDGTEYLTLTFNDTPPAGASSRNLYIAVALQGSTPVVGDLFLMKANIPISDTTVVDNGQDPITLFGAPVANTTAGVKVKQAVMADNVPVMYGNPDEPYTLYFPTVVEGGGVSFGGDAQSLKLLDGTNFYPTSVVGFRNNQNIPSLLTLFSGTQGVSKQQTITQKTLSYGNNVLTYWGADDLNAGASAVYSSYGTVTYLNQLLFPSSEGITSIKTEADLQNVLSPNIVSEAIEQTYKTIKTVNFDTIVSTAWDNLICFCLPTRGLNYNNQIAVYDLSVKQKPKWYLWDIEADWIGTISPPNRESFMYIRDGKYIYKLIDGYSAEDEDETGTLQPFAMEIESALMSFNQQKNSFFAMSQCVFYVAEWIGTINVTVSYYNQKGKLKSKTKTFTNGSLVRNFLGGWSNPRNLWRSWNNRVINWSTPIPTTGDTSDSGKVKRRLRVRTPNPVINEYKISISTDLSQSTFDLIGVAPEGVNVGIVGDIVQNKLMADISKYIAEWKKSKDFVYGYTRDFRDLDTIANAQYPRGSGKKPNVGDTTIAGSTRQMMRRAVKQLPVISMAINGSKQTKEAYIARFLVNDRILNPITFGKGFVNILRLGGRGAISRGFNAFQVKATKLYGEYGVQPALLHFSDVGIEPGVQDANLSSYHYVRTQYTPSKLKKIYEREKKNPRTTWNVKALKALMEIGPDGSGETEYAEWLIPSQQSSVPDGAETYTIVTRYCSDTYEDIISFSPTLNQELRTIPNRSKFGYPRVLFLVIDPAELSAFGDSRVRLASPNQNLMMALRQNVVATWLYNSDPTVVKTGMFAGATALKSGGIMTTTDPNAKVQLLTLDTTTSQQYPNISKEIKGQILDMLGYSPSANLGAIGESKTGVGAQTQRMTMDESSQEITHIIEEFVKQYILSAFDLYISQQDGEDVIYVDDETKKDIEAIDPELFNDPSNPNALAINWNDYYDYIKKIDVTVDTTISKDEFTDQKRADLQDTLTVMKQTADPNDPKAAAKAAVVEDEFLKEAAPDISQRVSIAEEQAQQVAPQMPQQMM